MYDSFFGFFFVGLKCVGHSFADVVHFVFLSELSRVCATCPSVTSEVGGPLIGYPLAGLTFSGIPTFRHLE
jgi:hypothetical protein